jgi:nicotinate-nucleotide pyrophosphorylase (carboxylating)
MVIKPEPRAVERLVLMALEEDAPWGDITSQAFIPPQARLRAHLVAREAGVLCGNDVFTAAMQLTDPAIEVEFAVQDGDHFPQGSVLATVQGSARGILRAERIGLNFVQRLSGIATLTAKYVAAAAGTRARIVDTRKTTPGLRLLERYAVRCGGGHNHRSSLSDAVLLKDNHLAILTRDPGHSLTATLLGSRARLPHTIHFEVEVDRLDQVDAVLDAGVDTILLDNFSTQDLRAAVAHIAGRCLVEASGGVALERIAEIAATGVDLISVGALTHSARWLDIGLDLLQE